MPRFSTIFVGISGPKHCFRPEFIWAGMSLEYAKDMKCLTVFISMILMSSLAQAYVLSEAEMSLLQDQQSNGAYDYHVELEYVEYTEVLDGKGNVKYYQVQAESIVEVKESSSLSDHKPTHSTAGRLRSEHRQYRRGLLRGNSPTL